MHSETGAGIPIPSGKPQANLAAKWAGSPAGSPAGNPAGSPAGNPVVNQDGHPAAPSSSRAARMLIDMLRRHVEDASLLIVDGEGRYGIGRHAFSQFPLGQRSGKDEGSASAVVLRVHRPDFYTRVLLQGNLGMGESYMEGGFDVDDGRLADLLTILLKARIDRKTGRDWRHALRYGAMLAGNLLNGKSRNVRRHYDVGEDLFDTFLRDPYQVYSCGYARSADADIHTLQQDKLDRICQKLELAPRQTLLDIGCGKGGLLIHAARHYGVRGTGVTNSLAHWERANALITEHGVGDRVRVLLQDYALVAGSFDRVGWSAWACWNTCTGASTRAISARWPKPCGPAAVAWCTPSVATRA